MNPAPPDNGELPAPVRQKLAVAQVRLLELTDAREALATQNRLLERTLAEAQAIADARSGERDHLAAVNTRLEAHAANLQAELEAARAALGRDQARLAALDAAAAAAARELADLRREFAGLQATRSWRWTAPFRALGRMFQGRA
jgi:chromosome segregation ATPase